MSIRFIKEMLEGKCTRHWYILYWQLVIVRTMVKMLKKVFYLYF